MRRIKFVRHLIKFFELSDSRHLIKDFDDLIKQLPSKGLNQKDLKEKFYEYSKERFNLKDKEIEELYNKIWLSKDKKLPIKGTDWKEVRKSGKYKNQRPVQGGSPGLGKGKS
tara:strand:- start:567 stop:902 length:336 start_codon:yes stop_codon:yes gene_type:complete